MEGYNSAGKDEPFVRGDGVSSQVEMAKLPKDEFRRGLAILFCSSN